MSFASFLVVVAAVAACVSGSAWTEQAVKGDVPSARFSCALVAMPTRDALLLFGGRAAGWTVFHNDTFVYDVPTATWRALALPAGPSPRFSPRVVPVAERTDAVYLFGGSYYEQLDAGVRNRERLHDYTDLWLFDFSAMKWTAQPAGVGLPRARQAPAVGAVRGRMLLFGGRDACLKNGEACPADAWTWRDMRNDTWVADLTRSPAVWTQVPTAVAPPVRVDAASWVRGSRVYVFGGRVFAPDIDFYTLNDMWAFDMDTLRWSPVRQTGDVPGARHSATAIPLDDSRVLVSHGGNSETVWFDNSYVFTLTSPTEGVWTRAPTSASPSPREGMSYARSRSGRAIAFGGKIYNKKLLETAYDDTWAFTL